MEVFNTPSKKDLDIEKGESSLMSLGESKYFQSWKKIILKHLKWRNQMIEVKTYQNLTAKNQKFLAVDNISFSVENVPFRVDWPDGSGKTTIFQNAHHRSSPRFWKQKLMD